MRRYQAPQLRQIPKPDWHVHRCEWCQDLFLCDGVRISNDGHFYPTPKLCTQFHDQGVKACEGCREQAA